ncbi:MAG: hypothetical protein NVV68_10405 [Dokdonella sp.]|nr:hypothetical protein [Dokdonella sp.]
MFAKSLRIAGLALSLVLATACSKETPSGETASPAAAKSAAGPEAAIHRSVALLKAGDIGGLIAHSLPPADYAKVKAEWGQDQDPPTDEERAQFAEMMAKLTAPDAEQTLYAEIEPQLTAFDAQYQQQLPMYVNMGAASCAARSSRARIWPRPRRPRRWPRSTRWPTGCRTPASPIRTRSSRSSRSPPPPRAR